MTKDKIDNVVETVKQKRGRKPKKVVEETNIVFSIQETTDVNQNTNENVTDNSTQNNMIIGAELDDDNVNADETNLVLSSETPQEEQKPGGKKRGRKPKGGKIIQQVVPLNNNKESKPNIILHLKCSLKDLQTNTFMSTNVECFNFLVKNDLNYEIINPTNETTQNNIQNKLICIDNINKNEKTNNN